MALPRRTGHFALVFLFLIALALPAHAQQDEGPLSWLTVTPRFWLSVVETVDFADLEKETFTVPMGGVSISAAPPVLGGFSFAFTVLAGEGEGDAFYRPEGVEGVIVDAEITRLDIELLARYQLPDTAFSLFFGPRFVRFNEEYTAFGEKIESNNDVVALEFGVGAATELGDSGRHRLFTNLMTGVAFIDTEFKDSVFDLDISTDATEPIFDLNAGYQYVFKRFVSLSARYRVFMVFTEDDFGLASTVMFHGPELGATIRFH